MILPLILESGRQICHELMISDGETEGHSMIATGVQAGEEAVRVGKERPGDSLKAEERKLGIVTGKSGGGLPGVVLLGCMNADWGEMLIWRVKARQWVDGVNSFCADGKSSLIGVNSITSSRTEKGFSTCVLGGHVQAEYIDFGSQCFSLFLLIYSDF